LHAGESIRHQFERRLRAPLGQSQLPFQRPAEQQVLRVGSTAAKYFVGIADSGLGYRQIAPCQRDCAAQYQQICPQAWRGIRLERVLDDLRVDRGLGMRARESEVPDRAVGRSALDPVRRILCR
jgi:hypothetical protein